MASQGTAAAPAAELTRSWRAVAAWSAAALLLALLALAAGIDHDEGQYVSAAQLTLDGWPYLDFAYLQTPLQPLLLAPLAGLDAGLRFPALRLASAALALAGLAGIYAAQRCLGVNARAAATATALIALTYPFLYGAGHARNDMLPMALFAGALWAAAAALARPRWWLVAGLLAGAATCAKISYGPLSAALALFVLLDPGARRWLPLVVAGGLIGAAPGLLLWAAAPEPFRFGVLEYMSVDPAIWYAHKGDGDRYTLAARLGEALWVLVRGPALVMLVLLAAALRGDAGNARARRLLTLLIAAGLVTALLPTPTYRQYFIPLLPPLGVAFGLLLAARWPGPRVWMALAVTGAVGTASFADLGRAAWTGRWPALDMAREAQWIGQELHAANAEGMVATLTPPLALDSGAPLDPRFAPGPFVWRTGDRIDPARQARLTMVSPATLDAAFAATPPAAIVTGYEGGDMPWNNGVDLDAPLAAWARAHGYRQLDSPVGAATLYLRR